MGSFLTTQFSWEKEGDSWKLAKCMDNDENLYLLYIETCNRYLEWFRTQDVIFQQNNTSGETEASILLTTHFSRPVKFVSILNMSLLTGGVSSQDRVNALLVQQQRLHELNQDESHFVTMNLNKTHQHRRQRRTDRASVMGLAEVGGLSVDIWSKVPDLFWRQYRLHDDTTVLTSEDVVTLSDDTDNYLQEQPAYTLSEVDDNTFSSSVWSVRHVVNHISIVLTLGFPTLMSGSTSSRSIDSSAGLDAVRAGLCRAYLFLDRDYLQSPAVCSQQLHNVLLKELRIIIEAFANHTGSAEETPEGAVSRAWQTLISSEPLTKSPSRKSAVTSVLRKRASTARMSLQHINKDDPVQAIAGTPLTLLSEALFDADSLASEQKNKDTARTMFVKPTLSEDARKNIIQCNTLFLDTASEGHSNPVSPRFQPRTPCSPFIRKDRCPSMIQKQPVVKVVQKKLRPPPALLDVTGDLRLLAPCEITAALYSQVQREETEDVNKEERAEDLKKWKEKHSSVQHSRNGSRVADVFNTKQSLHDAYQKFSKFITGLDEREEPERVPKTERKKRQELLDWEIECASDEDDEDFKRFSKPRSAKLQMLGDTPAAYLRQRSGSKSYHNHHHRFTKSMKLCVDKMAKVQRVIFAMVWQKFDIELLSRVASRTRRATSFITQSCCEDELASIESLVGNGVVQGVNKDPYVTPWRASGGELLHARIDLVGRVSLNVSASCHGWYLTTSTNNMAHVISQTPPSVAVLGQEGLHETQSKSSIFYPTLYLLLRDFSEDFCAVCDDDIVCNPSNDIPTVSDDRRKSSKTHTFVSSPILKTKDVSNVFNGANSAFDDEAKVCVVSPKREDRGKKTGGPRAGGFGERERKRKEMVQALRKHRATPLPCSSDMESSDDSDSEEGLSILLHGPKRTNALTRSTNIDNTNPGSTEERVLTPLIARPADRILQKPKFRKSMAFRFAREPGDTSSSEGSDSRETVNTLLRRSVLSCRDWNLCRDNNRLAHHMSSDLLTLGDPADSTEHTGKHSMFMVSKQAVQNKDDAFQFIAPPRPMSTKIGGSIAPQWLSFLHPETRPARMLFALRSILECDLAIPANQAALYKANAFYLLANITARRADYRLRICAATILLSVCQNPRVVKLMFTSVSTQLRDALISTCVQTDRSKGSAARGNMSKMAREAVVSPRIQSPETDLLDSHQKLQALLSFTLASMGLSAGRSRLYLWKLDVGSCAIELLAKPQPETLTTGLLHLVRSLFLKKQFKSRKLNPQMASTVVKLLSVQRSVAELQALGGVMCSLRMHEKFIADASEQGVVPLLVNHLNELASSLGSSRFSTADKLRSTVRQVAVTPTFKHAATRGKQNEKMGPQTRAYLILLSSMEIVLRYTGNAKHLAMETLVSFVQTQKAIARFFLGISNKWVGGVLCSFTPLSLSMLETEDSDTFCEWQLTLILFVTLTGIVSGLASWSTEYKEFLHNEEYIDLMCGILSAERPAEKGMDGYSPKLGLLVSRVKVMAAEFFSHTARVPHILDTRLDTFLVELRKGCYTPVCGLLCRVLTHMALQNTDVRRKLLLKGNLLALWSLLQGHESAVRTEAANCLRVLVCPADLYSVESRLACDEMAESFLSILHDKFSVLVLLLDPNHSVNKLVDSPWCRVAQTALCELIAGITHYQAAQALLQTENLLEILMELVRVPKIEVGLLCAVTHCLWLASEVMPSEVIAANAIPVLAEKLGTTTEADRNIVSMLRTLVSARENCHQICIASGVITPLVTLLGSTDASIQVSVASTLATIRRSQQVK